MWLFFSDICQSCGSCESIKVSIICTSWVFFRKLVFLKFLQEFQAARNFSKVSLHFNKMPNSLRQVLQMYSQTCISCVVQKIVLQKQLTKIDLKVPGRSFDEI